MANTTVAATNLYGFITDTEFRAFITAFGNALDAVGLVQTADTGQLNRATIVRAGNGVDAGYEVWRFDDAAQATAPVFFKLLYQSGYWAGPTGLRLVIELGTGSNGSGTLTGLGSGTTYVLMDGNPSAPTASVCQAASDGSGLTLQYLPTLNDTNHSWYMALDRFRDADGDPSGAGVYLFARGTSAGGLSGSVLTFSLVVDAVNNRVVKTATPFCFPTIPAYVAGSAWLDDQSQVSFYPWYYANPAIQHVKMIGSLPSGEIGFSLTDGPSFTRFGAASEYRLTRAATLGTPGDHFGSGLVPALWWSD